MNSITSSLNQSLLKGTFNGSSLLGSSSQSALLQSAFSQQIPDVQVFTGGESQSLAGAITQTLSESGNAQALQSLAQLNTYSASNSLLGAVYGAEGGTNALLAASYAADTGGSALLNSAYPSGNEAVDAYV